MAFSIYFGTFGGQAQEADRIVDSNPLRGMTSHYW